MKSEAWYKETEEIGGSDWRRFWEERHVAEDKIKNKQPISFIEAIDCLNYLAYIWDFKSYGEKSGLDKMNMEFPLWEGLYSAWVNSREKMKATVNIGGNTYTTTVLKVN
jgi:hypothetical protein